MGNALESLSPRRGVKRVREETEENPEDNGNISTLDCPGDFLTPKRKRTQSTAKYILKTLFEEGTESDMTINACSREWRLHKLYLCQCRYFDSMFNGRWREAEQSIINMEITDENIDQNALKTAFQSLYTDNVFVKPAQAVGVLAAATLLQLDPLIEHCKTVMKGCIAPDTVCTFYTASERYGLMEIKDLCLKWLQHCLMVPGYASLICHIQSVFKRCFLFLAMAMAKEDLLLTLLCSSDLWLMQVEVDIYTLLKKWVFIQLHPSWKGSREQLYSDSEEFFKRRADQDGGTCFLETEPGQRFIHMFKKIRWMYVINDLSSIQLIRDDKILPHSWLEPYFSFCWKHHLMIEQAVDKGPQQVSEEEFLERSMRCGRILLQEQDYCWRWVGYNFGLDLLITCRNRVLMIKRNGGSQHFEGLISQQSQRHVMIRLSLAPIRKKEPSPRPYTTGIKSLSLSPDEEVMLMQLGSDVKFPLQVTMNLLFVTPSTNLPVPSLSVPSPPAVCVPTPSASSILLGTTTTIVSASTPVINPAANVNRVSLDVGQAPLGERGSHISNASADINPLVRASTNDSTSGSIHKGDEASDCHCGQRRRLSLTPRERPERLCVANSRVRRASGETSGPERNQESDQAESGSRASDVASQSVQHSVQSRLSSSDSPHPGGPSVAGGEVSPPVSHPSGSQSLTAFMSRPPISQTLASPLSPLSSSSSSASCHTQVTNQRHPVPSPVSHPSSESRDQTAASSTACEAVAHQAVTSYVQHRPRLSGGRGRTHPLGPPAVAM